jgi:hypothetical protein
MKVFCKEDNHWAIIDGRLILKTAEGQDMETPKKMIKVLEAQIRLKIYEDICDLKLTDNRKMIMKYSKGSLDNLVLAVQALCADVALAEQKTELANANTSEPKNK